MRDGGREADIEEVKSLVLNIIKRPSCLILLVVSCESTFRHFIFTIYPSVSDRYRAADIENQGARRLAKQVDRSGKRTIRT